MRGLPRDVAGVCASLFFGVLVHASPAGAQDESPEGFLQPGGIPPRSVVWHRRALFDPYLGPRELIFTGGFLRERPIGTGDLHDGFEAAGGDSIETRQRMLFVRLEREYGFRYTATGHWVIALPRYTYAGGVALGPVEVTGRVGLTVAEVHFGSSGFGLGLFSPRVATGAAVRIGPVRLGALALAEYAWRWIGGGDARIYGAVVELSLGGRPKGLPAWYRVEN